MTFRGLLTESVLIERRDVAPADALGYSPESFSEIGSVACAIQAPKISSMRAVGGILDRPTLSAWFESGVDVKVEDRLTVESSGRIFRVAAIEDAAGRFHHLEAFLVEVV